MRCWIVIRLSVVAAAALSVPELCAESSESQRQLEEHQQRASRWDHATAERFFRKGAWREGVAYLGRACRLDPQNSAAARHLWSAVVDGEGDRDTLPELVLRQDAEINVALFSPDGCRILVASADKTARLLDAATGVLVGEPMRHEDEIVTAVFSPDGARIATASKDRTARLWDGATGKPFAEFMRHEHPLDELAFNSTGTRIVTQCGDAGLVQLWDAANGVAVSGALPHKAADGQPAIFSPDGKWLTTIDGENARTWDTATGKVSGKTLRLPPGARHIVFSPDRKYAATLSNGKAQDWNASTGKLAWTLSMKKTTIESAEFSPDGTRILTLAEESGELWETATGRRVGDVLAGMASPDTEGGTTAYFSPDSTFVLLSTHEDKLLRAWDCETGGPFAFSSSNAPSFLQHPEEVLEVHIAADGARIVTTCQDHAVRVWDAETGAPIGEPLRHKSGGGDGLKCIALSADGTGIVTADAKNIVRVWRIGTGQSPAEPLPGGAGEPETIPSLVAGEPLAVSADGLRVLTLSDPETVQLAVAGQPVGEPLRHAEGVRSAAFSPDGATFVVVGDEGTARLWNALTAMPVSEPLLQERGARTAFSADGARLLTQGETGHRVREVPPMLNGAGTSARIYRGAFWLPLFRGWRAARDPRARARRTPRATPSTRVHPARVAPADRVVARVRR